MGSSFCHRTYESNDRKAIIESWGEAVDSSRYEDGASYSGNIGMLTGGIVWHDEKCGSEEEAIGRLDEVSEKWGPPHAVSFRGGSDNGKTLEDLRQKAWSNLHEAERRAARLISKCERATCSKCESVIVLAFHNKGTHCPVCNDHHGLALPESRDELAQLKAAAEELRDRRPAPAPKDASIWWVVGGQCPS